ncbi:MAG: TetR family transcriptional regulator [Alphaproteobacteria bacterium]|nr:TetR family transcriptional regulator [Alphaproteobacteria bacterium]
MSVDKAPVRKPRADAEQNRQLLLETAKAAFSEKGASVPLEEIARTAGVGIGTLYRHFPNREALLQEVYADESEKLVAAAERLIGSETPLEALREWLRLFVRYFATKQLVIEALGAKLKSTGPGIETAINTLARNAEKSGDIKLDVSPMDILRAVVGMAAYAKPGWEKNAYKMIDIVLAGMRPD